MGAGSKWFPRTSSFRTTTSAPTHIDKAVHVILRPAAVAGLLYFAVLVPLHAVVLDPPTSWFLMATAATASLCYGAFLLLWRRHPPPTHLSHEWAAVVLAPAYVNSSIHLILTAQPIQSTNLMIFSLATALLLLDTKWYAGIQVATAAAWATAVWIHPSTDWIHWGFALGATVTLSTILFVGRRHAVVNLAAARDRDQRASDNLRAAYHELESFSYTVSHDLRAPLRAINTLVADVLEDASIEEDVREPLVIVAREAARMGALIDDLLNLSKMAEGGLNIARIDISDMAHAVSEELDRRAPSRVTKWRIEPGITVDADARLMRVALANLMENAWKYTADTPTPVIRVARDHKVDADMDGFLIEDNGVGFSNEDAARIFAPFTRLEPGRFAGTGIGLATVRRIIDRHEGRVVATGELGKGATFRVSVPRRS